MGILHSNHHNRPLLRRFLATNKRRRGRWPFRKIPRHLASLSSSVSGLLNNAVCNFPVIFVGVPSLTTILVLVVVDLQRVEV
eukprot:m.160866 g.160866  ORF g.160866 m.160866 type:complete len:82 (+) comp38789_c2_seq1:163-408(+)